MEVWHPLHGTGPVLMMVMVIISDNIWNIIVRLLFVTWRRWRRRWRPMGGLQWRSRRLGRQEPTTNTHLTADAPRGGQAEHDDQINLDEGRARHKPHWNQLVVALQWWSFPIGHRRRAPHSPLACCCGERSSRAYSRYEHPSLIIVRVERDQPVGNPSGRRRRRGVASGQRERSPPLPRD